LFDSFLQDRRKGERRETPSGEGWKEEGREGGSEEGETPSEERKDGRREEGREGGRGHLFELALG